MHYDQHNYNSCSLVLTYHFYYRKENQELMIRLLNDKLKDVYLWKKALNYLGWRKVPSLVSIIKVYNIAANQSFNYDISSTCINHHPLVHLPYIVLGDPRSITSRLPKAWTPHYQLATKEKSNGVGSYNSH